MKTIIFLVSFFLLGVVQAGFSPSMCDDISGIAETPNVDFETQIQPIFNNGCTGCHGGSGNLFLTPGNAYGNLVGVAANAQIPVYRVQAGDASQSFLFWKVNCDNPVAGSRMPIGGTLSAAEQALIRDWINQGAAAVAAGPATPVPGSSNMSLAFMALLLFAAGAFSLRRKARLPRG